MHHAYMLATYMHMASKKRPARPPPGPPAAPSRAPGDETEAEFLARYDVTAFERPSVTVDVVLLTADEGALWVAVHRRDQHPARGAWALPGGFVGLTESLPAAAARVLAQKAGVDDVFIEQLYTFGAPHRDPRGRVITVAYYALVAAARLREAAEKASCSLARVSVPWSGETGGPVELLLDGQRLEVAFDHADIIGLAVQRLRGKLDYTPVGFQLLPASFTLRELQAVHEAVKAEPVNKDSFRRRMLGTGHLEATGERESDTSHRPAELYRFVKRSAL